MIGLVTVALQLIAELLRLRREHAVDLGVSKLSSADRKALDAAVVASVKTKNTADLEGFLKDGAIPTDKAGK